ncbi:hypothetical protein BDR05DRAFT_985759 [Suillus weaverae]|nr:hypothetical protein BDR05DRAFT_985759 [Suillus weaverae]
MAGTTSFEILKRISQRVQETLDKTQTSSGTANFNHEYVPSLEYFFAENPFPTHADKAFLAKKSAMTYRQIHVWFQNRRNRMKKEGQVLRKKAVAEGATHLLDNLYVEIHCTGRKEGARVASQSSAFPYQARRRDDNLNPLEPLAPLHAFPSVYPPSCLCDPFPSNSGVTNFGAPKWLRRPTNTAIRRPPLDIDGLVDRFSRINVLDNSGSRSRGSDDSFAAVAAITTIPYPAPLPALVRGSATRIAPVRVPLHSVPASLYHDLFGDAL